MVMQGMIVYVYSTIPMVVGGWSRAYVVIKVEHRFQTGLASGTDALQSIWPRISKLIYNMCSVLCETNLTSKVSFTAPWNGGTIRAEADTLEELTGLIQQIRKSSLGRRTTRSFSKSLENNDQELPQVLDPLGCADAIRKLLSTPWGGEPRSEKELTTALRANALHYSHGTISGLLIHMTRRGQLRRIRKANGYAYVLSLVPQSSGGDGEAQLESGSGPVA